MKTNKKIGLTLLILGLMLMCLPVSGLVQLGTIGDSRQLFACDSLSETGSTGSQGVGTWTATTGSTINTQNKIEGSGSIQLASQSLYGAYIGSMTHSFAWSSGAQFTSEHTIRLSVYMSAINDFKNFRFVLSEYRPASNTETDFCNWQWSIPLVVGWQTVDISLDNAPAYFTSSSGETYTSPLLNQVTLIGVTYITNTNSNPIVNIDDICAIYTSATTEDLSVTLSPISAAITTNQTQIFTAVASGGTPTYSYSWYYDGTVVPQLSENSFTVSGASVGSHSIYVSVTDSASGQAQTATSQTAALTVTATSSDTNTTIPENPPPVTGDIATLIVTAGAGGTVSPSGTSNHTLGETITLMATPNNGYAFNYWVFNNGTQISTNPLVLNIQDSYSINAIFYQIPTTVTQQFSFDFLGIKSSNNILLQIFGGIIAFAGIILYRKK